MLTERIPLECNEAFVGDGFCDDLYNFAHCNFDEGDCCLLSTKSKQFCSECTCLSEPSVLPSCKYQGSVSNGICDDFSNVLECGFDGGKY